MASLYKVEYPPLLMEGLHELTLADLRVLCVDGFPLSTRRDPVMRVLESMCLAMSTALVPAAVWVDGSFLTEKIEPDDVDVVVVMQAGNRTSEQQAVIDRIENQEFVFPVTCDSYVNVEYPQGHKKYWFSQYMRAYWIKQFGFARNDKVMKGIAVVRTPTT